jgi:putative transposase
MNPAGRQHPAHGVHEYLGNPTIVFDTACSKDRQPWLACNEVHSLLREVWQKATAWQVGRYMIMPDHVHYFAAYTGSAIKLENWAKYWKSQFTKQWKQLHGIEPGRWQTDHWDRRIRTFPEYEAKWNYVVENPIRAGLVKRSEDWQYQGHIFVLPWH